MSKSKDVNWSEKKKHADRAEKKKRLSNILDQEHDKALKQPIDVEYDKNKEDYGVLP